MLTFDNTIATNKTYLNLRNVSKIIFAEKCLIETDGKKEMDWWDVCHIVIFNDNTANIISAHTFSNEKPERAFMLEQKYSYLSYNGELLPVIRDKKLFDSISELRGE